MSRIFVFMRHIMNNSSMHPLPVAEFQLPRASDTTLELFISDLGNDKQPLDLSSINAEFVVRRKKYPTDSDDIVIIRDMDNGISVDTDNPGYMDIHFDYDLLNLTPTKYWYTLTIYLPTSVVRQSLGKFIIIP